MTHGVILHVSGEVPIFGEVEELPTATATIIVVNNPRTREGKDLHYIADDVTQVIWPISKINFIEIMPSEDEDQIIGFVRE